MEILMYPDASLVLLDKLLLEKVLVVRKQKVDLENDQGMLII